MIGATVLSYELFAHVRHRCRISAAGASCRTAFHRAFKRSDTLSQFWGQPDLPNRPAALQ